MSDAKAAAELLGRRAHHDPHTILGVHPVGDAWTIRAWRPLAKRVVAHPDASPPIELDHVASALFAAPLAQPLGRYEIETIYPDGSTHRAADPYAFAPTVGALDLHLITEGRHEELWRALGAQAREIDGVAGIGFAVWAPSARSVSVVGDWNGWDGTAQPMRSLGRAGVWELFVPGLADGAQYKFEIHGPDGAIKAKTGTLSPIDKRSVTP